jgi:tryptophanyl-tRNA synthetase
MAIFNSYVSLPEGRIFKEGSKCWCIEHLLYVGSLQNRVFLQAHNTQYIMIANLQALTDNMDSFENVYDNIFELVTSLSCEE